MQPSSSTIQPHPVLPAPLSLAFKLIPSFIHNKALVTALNRIFHQDLKQGELDFLQGKVVHISEEDAGIEYRFTLNQGKSSSANKNQSAGTEILQPYQAMHPAQYINATKNSLIKNTQLLQK